MTDAGLQEGGHGDAPADAGWYPGGFRAQPGHMNAKIDAKR